MNKRVLRQKQTSQTQHKLTPKDIVFILLLIATAGVMLWKMTFAPQFMMLGTIIPHVATSEKVIALTLDDGPLPKRTQEVLTSLRQKKVKATFFVIGKEATLHTNELHAIVADGHAVGNHSFTHRALVGVAPKTVSEEIERTDALIRAAGYRGDIPFRAPYNAKLFMLPLYLTWHNRPDVSRDILPLEGKRRSAQQITDEVVAQAHPGGIILLHPMYAHTQSSRDAIPRIIDALHAKGYRFVTIPELLALDD